MVKKKTKDEVLKYIEINLPGSEKWDWIDYLTFIIETGYNTLFPFFIGYFVKAWDNIWLLFFLILPIYINLRIKKKLDEKARTKRIYPK